MTEPDPGPEVFTVPAALRELLARELAEASGSSLRAVVVRPIAHRLEGLAIFGHLDAELLRQVGPVLRRLRREHGLTPILLTEREVGRCLDVFPARFAAFAREGVALHGVNPLVGREPRREHLRLRVEQELRNQGIRLRQRLVASQGDALGRQQICEQLAHELLTPLRSLLELGDDPEARDLGPGDLLRRGAHLVEGAAPLERLLPLLGPEPAAVAADLPGALLPALAALADHVDALEEEG